MDYIPEKGDIISINFDPSAGKEIMKRRPAFVISRSQFHEVTGFAIVAPITSTNRSLKIEVTLPNHCQTQGNILVHQVRSLDFEARQIHFIETVPGDIVDKVDQILRTITR